MKKSTITNQWLYSFLLLIMAMVVPRQAYAGAHFNTAYGRGTDYYSRLYHHPTVDEPWIGIFFWFYDMNGYDGFFLHDETEKGHRGPAIYIDGKYICSPDWELAWPGEKGNGNDLGLEDQRGNNGWWGDTYTKEVDGVNYTVRFWDPRKLKEQFWVEMIIYMDKMAVATQHDIKIRGKWRINETSEAWEERTFRSRGIKNIFADSPTYERTYGSLKVKESKLNTSYGPTTVAMTTDDSYYKDYSNGKRYFDPSTLNKAVYKTYSKGSSTYNGLTLSYDETDGSSFYLYRQKSITVTPKDRPSTIIFGWQMDTPYSYDVPRNVAAPTDMWKKQILLIWQAYGRHLYANGTWSIYRYPDGHPEDKTKVAGDIPYNTRKYTDDVPDYDQKYVYEVYFVPTNSPSGKLLSSLMASTTQSVQRSFPINISDVVSDKKSITVKWQCPEFKGNESYAFKLFRTISKNGKPGDDWTEVATVNVTDKGKTRYEYTDTRDLKLCPTYIYKVQTTMLENKLFSSTNILEGRITGNSQVTAVNATKGDYNGLVKVAWEADQVGSDVTRYEVARRVKGTDTWATIYKTSGTASSYYYEDQTALPGQYYDYKVVSITTCDGSDTRLEKSDDGFSRATGIVSGRITYGTGTAVAGTRVALVRGDGTQQQGGQFYALRVSGAGDGVFLSKDSETLNKYFASKPYTMQMMIRPDDAQTGTTPTILDLGSKLQLTLGAADANGKGYPLTLKSASASAPTGIYLKPNAFTSLTLAVDAAGAATVTAVNAEDSVTVVPLADKLSAKVQFANSDNTGLCLGGSYQSSANHAFSGYIDEMRVFSGKALTKDEILANYNHTLCGTEDGLIAYWPVDEGFSGQTTAYDYSKTSGVANGNHARLGAGTSPTGSVIPTSHQLGLFGLTDAQGNFVIRGVPFTGDGTNYMVIPAMGIHEYSPTYSTRYVSASSLVHSGVDFTDVSSFPVSGTVFYEGTDYPVEECTFYVDGTICSRDGELIQSAEDGTFTISVPIGDHFIQVKKDGHVFASAGRYPADPNGAGVKITFDREIKNMEFIDQTLVNFTGRVVGGSIEGEKPVGFGASQNNIGITELVLSPTNDRYRLNVVKKTNGTSYSYETNTSKAAVESATSVIASHSWRGAGDAAKKIFIRTDSLTGEFSAMVPPLMYNVESMKVVATGLSVGDATTIDATYPLVQLTDTLVTENGVRQEYAYNCKLNQTYHSAPSFTVTQRGHDDGAFGLSEYEIEDANGKLTGDDLNISFNQFDRNYHNLKAFRIQYRKQGDTDWTLVCEYVINEADKTQNNELLPSTATVSYKLPMHNFSDGNYTFRILSVSTYGNEEVYNTSEEIALVKDIQRPQPLGMPTPTNGILSPGDDVSIEFNENFLKGELTKTANFIVTGVLNGAEVSHATALGMTGTDNTAATEADINLAGKSFAIDAWVNLNGAGTLLTHGKGEQKLVVGMDDNRHLQVKIDDNVYTSKTEMPTDKWAYLTINYAANANGCTLKAAVAEDATTTDLFTNEAVAAYDGNGPLAIGQHLTGAIHELTLWDEAHDMTAALMEKNKTKNPATRHLIGYWKMDEGEGTVITDYARNRHLRMTGENWYLNNENKAITLDGTSHLDIPTADVSAHAAHSTKTERTSTTVSLWAILMKSACGTPLLAPTFSSRAARCD